MRALLVVDFYRKRRAMAGSRMKIDLHCHILPEILPDMKEVYTCTFKVYVATATTLLHDMTVL